MDHQPSIPNRQLLLLRLLSAVPDSTLPDRLSQLTESDWSDLLHSASAHSVATILYHRLSHCPPPRSAGVPPASDAPPPSIAPSASLCSHPPPSTFNLQPSTSSLFPSLSAGGEGRGEVASSPAFNLQPSTFTPPPLSPPSPQWGEGRGEVALDNQPSTLNSQLTSLRESFFLHAARNSLLYRDLAEVVTKLQNAGIQVAVLKGAHLAALVYPHISLRPMADMDLLVPEEALSKAGDLLRKMGYTTDSDQDIQSRCRISQHIAPFSKPSHPRIELHWTIAPPALRFRVDMAGLRKRLHEAVVGGIQTHILSPEDLLLHICIHAAGHRPMPFCHGLRSVCDIAAVTIHHPEMDWSLVKVRAIEWQAALGVYVALRLASELVQAEVPPAMLAEMRTVDFDEQSYALARKHACSVDQEAMAEESGIELSRFRTVTSGTSAASPVDGLKFLLQSAFPTQKHMSIYMDQFHHLPLTGHRRYTCYLTRALDMAGRGLRLLHYGAKHRQEVADRVRHVQEQARLAHWLAGSAP